MSAFSSFCVPEVEGCGPVGGVDGGLKRLPVIEQTGVLELSLQVPEAGVAQSQPPCLQHITANCDSTAICCIDAESTLSLINPNQFRCTSILEGAHNAPVTSCFFFHQNNHVLATSSQDGSIKIWDFRAPRQSKHGPATAEATIQIAPSGSREADMWALAVRGDDQVFAASFNDSIKGYDLRAICSGSSSQSQSPSDQKKKQKRRRLLWDLKIHGDVVTALQFLPLYPHLLASGGEDSLICISDTIAVCADDEGPPVVACFSQERAVKGLSLLGPGASCVCIRSAMEDVSLWQVEGLDRYCSGQAGDVASVQRKAEWLSVRSHPAIREGDSSGYVIDSFYDDAAGRLFILAGSVAGRLLLLHANLDGVAPAAVFRQGASQSSSANHGFCGGTTAGGGHCGVVRDAISLPGVGGSNSVLLTCGEDGRVCAWQQVASLVSLCFPSALHAQRGFEDAARSTSNVHGRHAAAVKPC